MAPLLLTILPALLPAFSDGVRGLISKFTGGRGAEPQNVQEKISLMEADVKRLEALAMLDRPIGPISPWVANLRAASRYVATLAIIATALVLSFIPDVPAPVFDAAWNLAGGAFFFLFGERSYFNLMRKR
jgi:hypothetical protein